MLKCTNYWQECHILRYGCLICKMLHVSGASQFVNIQPQSFECFTEGRHVFPRCVSSFSLANLGARDNFELQMKHEKKQLARRIFWLIQSFIFNFDSKIDSLFSQAAISYQIPAFLQKYAHHFSPPGRTRCFR